MRFPRLAVVLFLLALLSACSDYKPMAIGPEGRIVVFADSSVYQEAKPYLQRTVFREVLAVPRPESMLEEEWQDARQFEPLKQRAYLLFLASADDTSFASRLALSLLSDDVKNLVAKGEQTTFTVRNKWRNGQQVMFVIAPSKDAMGQTIMKDSAAITFGWTDFTLKRAYHHMFRRHSQPDLEERLLERVGFTPRIQHDYVVIHDSVGPNFVYLKRIQPDLDRWFWIHWWDAPTPAFPTFSRLMDIQDSVLKVQITAEDSTYAETDRRALSQKEISFNGFYGVETRGLWRMNDYSLGGPFVNYTFYNDSLNRIYMFNGSVLAPKFQSKADFVREMEVIARSIRFREGKGATPELR
ncbi:MAG: DUF4837 family protein [Bacteroidetes bacterium]|nr:DUF4837 family protein [Bacteroidota bacterium]